MSGWYEPDADTVIQSWSWLIKGWQALYERSFGAVPRGSWPAVPLRIATSASETAVSETGFSYAARNSSAWQTVVFDHEDPRYVVKGAIQSTSTDSTLVIVKNGDWTMRMLNGGGVGAGTHYAVIGFDDPGGSRSPGTWWWSDRVPSWPNDPAFYNGTATSRTTSSITADVKWGIDQWVGYYVYVRVGSQTQIIQITSNTTDTLNFGTQSDIPSSIFAIYDVPVGKYWSPEHVQSDYIFKWYSGNKVPPNWTHQPDDSLGASSSGASKTWQGISTYPWCLDVDFWTKTSDTDWTRDIPASETIWKSIRQVQAGLINLCSLYTPGLIDNGPPFNYLGPAHAFGSSSLSTIYPNSLYFWAVYETKTWTQDNWGSRAGTGSGLTNVLTTDSSGNPPTVSYTESDSAGTYHYLYWQGFTRKRPLEFRYMFPKTCFMPGLVGSTYYPTPVNESGKAGSWITRDASTKFLEFNHFGSLLETQDFAENDIARFIGDNANDPTTDQTYDPSTKTLAQYKDRWFVGVKSTKWTNSYAGICTGGGPNFIENSNASWPIQGIVQTETGTASGGSTSTVVDSSKSGSYFWATNRWAGHIVQVKQSGNWISRPIVSNTSTTLTLFGSLPASASGCDYKIVAPIEINYFIKRTLSIKTNSGNFSVKVKYSNDKYMFFDDPGLPTWDDANPWSYSLNDPKPGSVWKLVSGNWTPSSDLPGTMTRKGLICKGDYLGPWIFTEFKTALQSLTTTIGAPSWTTPDDGYGVYSGTGTISLHDGATATVPTAEAAIDGRVGSSWGGTLASGNPPAMQYGVTVYEDLQGNPPTDPPPIDTGNGSAYSHRSRGVLTNSKIQTGTVTFYNWADEFSPGAPAPYAIVWADYGQAVSLRAWTANGGGSVGVNQTVYGDVIGSTEKPDPPSVNFITHLPVDTNMYQGTAGFEVIEIIALIVWDFSL